MKNNIIPHEGTKYRKTLLEINDISKNCDPHDPPTKPPTPTNFPRVIVQSKHPTIVPRLKPHSNYTTRFPRVQPPAATPSPQPTLRRSPRIRNRSKPIVHHNANATIHLSALEEKFISDMMNINAVLDPTTGYLLELRQLTKTPEYKLWRDGALNELARLAQGRKKRTIKVTNTIHFISPNQNPTNKKSTYARIFVSYQPQK